MDLPPELVLEVLFFLDYSSRLRMLLVSRRHYRLISSQRPQLGLPKVWTPTHYYRTIRARAVCGAVSAGLVSAGTAAWIMNDNWPVANEDKTVWLWAVIEFGMRYGSGIFIAYLLAGATLRYVEADAVLRNRIYRTTRSAERRRLLERLYDLTSIFVFSIVFLHFLSVVSFILLWILPQSLYTLLAVFFLVGAAGFAEEEVFRHWINTQFLRD